MLIVQSYSVAFPTLMKKFKSISKEVSAQNRWKLFKILRISEIVSFLYTEFIQEKLLLK